MWPVISEGSNLWNQGIVVVKPHAVSLSSPLAFTPPPHSKSGSATVNDETVRYIQSFLIEHGITVCRKGETKEKGSIFNTVYQVLVQTSTADPSSLTISRKDVKGGNEGLANCTCQLTFDSKTLQREQTFQTSIGSILNMS
eukprot:1568765-Amphidinium_carterae.1